MGLAQGLWSLLKGHNSKRLGNIFQRAFLSSAKPFLRGTRMRIGHETVELTSTLFEAGPPAALFGVLCGDLQVCQPRRMQRSRVLCDGYGPGHPFRIPTQVSF